MNAITSCYADLSQKESGWTDTPKKTLHIWLIGPILCLGRSLAIEPQDSYLSRNWTVFTPWKFLPPRSLLELVQLAIAFYEDICLNIKRRYRTETYSADELKVLSILIDAILIPSQPFGMIIQTLIRR